LLDAYVSGFERGPGLPGVHSLMVAGPELPVEQRQSLAMRVAPFSDVTLVEFVDDMIGYMGAADAVVSMAGYNTVCEILSTRTPAVVVPRVRPVAEQWIRAQRMGQLGLFDVIHPDVLSPEDLLGSVRRQLGLAAAPPIQAPLAAGSLFRASDWISSLMPPPATPAGVGGAIRLLAQARMLAAAV
jgi:predicted glycosyltransferase